MFSNATNSKKGRVKKTDETRAAGGDPIKTIDDFVEEENLEGFFKDYNSLSEENQKAF